MSVILTYINLFDLHQGLKREYLSNAYFFDIQRLIKTDNTEEENKAANNTKT